MVNRYRETRETSGEYSTDEEKIKKSILDIADDFSKINKFRRSAIRTGTQEEVKKLPEKEKK